MELCYDPLIITSEKYAVNDLFLSCQVIENRKRDNIHVFISDDRQEGFKS